MQKAQGTRLERVIGSLSFIHHSKEGIEMYQPTNYLLTTQMSLSGYITYNQIYTFHNVKHI